jgi:hypothetical protein
MSPLTGLGFNQPAEAINMPPLRGFTNCLLTACCHLPTAYYSCACE